MDSVSPELKKRASQIYRHNLTGILFYNLDAIAVEKNMSLFFLIACAGILEGALRSCNAQYEPAYVLDKITVRLLEPSPGKHMFVNMADYSNIVPD